MIRCRRIAPPPVVLALAAVAFAGPGCSPRQPAGAAKVLAADTLEVGGRSVRLRGIDAPALDEECEDERGAAWPCGREAAEALRAFIGGRRVACTGARMDGSGDLWATCFVAEEDLAAWLVFEGWAHADRSVSTAYSEREIEARRERRGLWRAGESAEGP